MDSYVEALIEEIGSSKRKEVSSIFIGGGTPSLLSTNHLKNIVDKLKGAYNLTNDTEITIEANPGTLSIKFLEQIKEIGINRLSIGIQSFNNSELEFLQRIHDSNTAEQSINNARKAGFENISIDLIFSIPSQTKDSWAYSLEKAISYDIEHISCYSLTYEQGTPLYNMFRSGKVRKQSDDMDAEMFEYAIDILNKNGFIHYEVSNYAKPGKECKHNLNYWNGGTYSGFGSAAHSFDGRTRYWNIRSVDKYVDMVNNAGNALAGQELLTDENKLEETVFLSIRCGNLPISRITNNPPDKLLNELKMMEKHGYITFNNDVIRLTKKGFLLADDIALRILAFFE